MNKIRVSCVSYLNSKPFIHGLQQEDIAGEIELQLDIPSACADKLKENKVDIGLVPVAALAGLKDYYFVSDYCIGADGAVGSVLLLSEVPLTEIATILLDYQSRTSVMLARVLAMKLWNIKPRWSDTGDHFEKQISGTTAAVVIGDRTFSLKAKYVYDLSAEWKKLTGLPFVFACWIANKKLPDNFIKKFNRALSLGLGNKEKVISQYANHYPSVDIKKYLEHSISYIFDDRKKQSLQLFHSYINELTESDMLKIV